MISLIPALGAGSTVKSVVLETTGDTYVVTDNSNEQDPEGLRDRNFGALGFSRAWYRWKVLEEEQLVSISLFQSDLTPIQDKDIVSAHLQLFALRANLDQPVRLVDTHLVTAPWSELEMTYNTRPPWTRNPIARRRRLRRRRLVLMGRDGQCSERGQGGCGVLRPRPARPGGG